MNFAFIPGCCLVSSVVLPELRLNLRGNWNTVLSRPPPPSQEPVAVALKRLCDGHECRVSLFCTNLYYFNYSITTKLPALQGGTARTYSSETVCSYCTQCTVLHGNRTFTVLHRNGANIFLRNSMHMLHRENPLIFHQNSARNLHTVEEQHASALHAKSTSAQQEQCASAPQEQPPRNPKEQCPHTLQEQHPRTQQEH